jgi:pilus assembly protein CpaB
MKPRTIVPLIIGLVVGFFAIKMGIDMVKRAKGAETAEKSVLVCVRQVETASRIEESMLGFKKVAASLVPPDAFTDKEALTGRVTAMAIPPGVPITKPMLAPPGSQPGLRAKIPAGYRAVSVSVNEESAVAGFIMPGSRVDVSAVCKRAGQSKLILSDVEVGAVGQSLSQVGPDGKTVRITKSVTLFLKPNEVQTLNAANSGTGNIRLALRGQGRDAKTDSLWSRVLSKAMETRLPQAPVVVVDKPKPASSVQRHVVEVIRGTDAEKLLFVRTGTKGPYRLARDMRMFEDLQGQGPDGPDGHSRMEITE